MSGESDVKAGDAYVELTARDKAALAAIGRVERRFTAMGATLTAVGKRVWAVGSLIGVALVGAAVAWSDAASNVVDAADRIGASVEEVSALNYAAEQSGASAEALEAGWRKSLKTIADARDGSKSAAEALNYVGLSAAELQDLSPAEQFKAIAKQIAKIPDAAGRTAAAMKIMGKGGAALLPMLGNIEELTARAAELGLVMNDEDARAAEAFGDLLSDLKKTVLANVYAVGAALVPELRGLVDWLAHAAAGARAWIDQNRGLVVLALKVAAALVAGGAALLGLGGVFTLVGKALSFAGPLLTAFKFGLSAVSLAFSALLSPVGLVVAAVAGVVTIFAACTETGRDMVTGLVGWFKQLGAAFGQAWGGIANALKSGDLGLAAKIGLSFLRVEWNEFTAWLMGKWHYLESLWIDVVGFFGGLWDSAVLHFRNIWEDAVSWLANRFIDVEEAAGSITAEEAAQQRTNVIENEAKHKGAAQAKFDASTAARDDAWRRQQAGINAQIADERKAVEAARAEYQALLNRAADQAAGVGGAAPNRETAATRRFNSGYAAAKIDEQRKFVTGEASGTFNAAAAFSLASSPIKRVEEFTERTAEAVEEIAFNSRQGGLAVG